MKTFLLAACLLVGGSAFGQLTEGTIYINGLGSFSSSSESYHQEFGIPATINNYTATIKTLQLTAGSGYFIKDRLALGLRTGVDFSNKKTYDVNGYTAGKAILTQILVGPSARYYFLDIDKHWNLLADADFQYGFASDPYANGKGHSIRYDLGGGATFFFNSAVGLELLLGYQNIDYHFRQDNGMINNKTSAFVTKIGFVFYFDK